MDILDLVSEFADFYEESPRGARDVLRVLVSILGKSVPGLRDISPMFDEETASFLWEVLKTARTKADIEDFIFAAVEEVGSLEAHRRLRRRLR